MQLVVKRINQGWRKFFVLCVMAGMTGAAFAAAVQKKTQAPAYYRMMLGKFEVTALLDENSPWPEMLESLFPKLTPQQKQIVSKDTKISPRLDFSTIAFLINTGERLILIDTGGNGQAPGYGKLFENLQAAGYHPEQIDEVFITHMHGDHVGGLLRQEQIAFPNARLHLDQREYAEWQTLAKQDNANARRVLQIVDTYKKQNKLISFDGQTQFMPGFEAIPAYGHTAGHSFYRAESEGEVMLFWGDFVVNDKVQLEFPELAPPGEKDQAAGIALRQTAYQDAAHKAYLIAGAHFAFPGIGRLRQLNGKFIWIPIDYASIPSN